MLGEADRERLTALKDYMSIHWAGIGLLSLEQRAKAKRGYDIVEEACGSSGGHHRRDFAKAEIARLEALDADDFHYHHERCAVAHGGRRAGKVETSASIDRVRQLVEDGRIILKPSIKLLEAFAEEACADDEPKPKPKPAVQSLDDFMRQRDDADERRRALERAPACRISERAERGLAGEEDSEQSNRPASRELVGRMVRDATAHSKWPVEINLYDDCVEAWARMPNSDIRLIAAAHLPIKTMEHVTFCRSHITGWTDKMNHKACPACDGKGKTRGELMWGEQDCHECEGSGMR